ncbi:hypothetical protein IAU60_002964 [Kwoniella sp. DSM 27419]
MLADMSNSVPPPQARRRPKPQAENWDDDFEFSLPSSSKRASQPAGVTSSSSVKGKEKEKDENVPLSTGTKGRRQSLEEDWDEDWDAPPTRASLPPVSTSSSRREQPRSIPLPPPLIIPSGGHSLPPRLSPSHDPSLPTTLSRDPLSAGLSYQQPLPASSSQHSAAGSEHHRSRPSNTSRSRSGSTTSNPGKNKLVKRHPSASFVQIPSRSSSRNPSSSSMAHDSGSSVSLSSLAFAAGTPRGMPDDRPPVPPLPRSTSGEQMPPPPLPKRYSMTYEQTRAESSPVEPTIRVSAIPFSPSRDDMRGKEKTKKAGFWKRLSGAPTDEKDEPATPTQIRRKRSSSLGNRATSSSSSPRPPVPPLPANLRSPSAKSFSSVASDKSVSGPVSAFSALLRRSSSSLSRRSDKSKERPPSAYPQSPQSGRRSTSSVHSAVSQHAPPVAGRSGNVTPEMPTSQSFSRGFHLPSPSPRSPYSAHHARLPSVSYPNLGTMPPLPHSTSFPGPQAITVSGSDTETEGEEKTPRRRKKVRPVSAVPAPRTSSLNGWLIEDCPSPVPQIPGLPISRQSSAGYSSSSKVSFASSSSSKGVASGMAIEGSALKRLGSLSKKQGRRISGGLGFESSSSLLLKDQPAEVRSLEPVQGSPSKPVRSKQATRDQPTTPPSALTAWSNDDRGQVSRAGSLSAPNSLFKPTGSDLWPNGLAATQTDDNVTNLRPPAGDKRVQSQRRRQSWNEFVIPREVMAKQKGLKENIGAVKKFASGVASLRSLLRIHEEMRIRVAASGTPANAARFSDLDREFAQWLEMAVVLIEVGSTGSDPSTQPSYSSPPRTRRVTMASEEARLASAAMSKALSAPGGPKPQIDLSSWRKASLPDPEELDPPISPGPPRAEWPDHSRASTGRQDLSKRQLEVLRSMLRTPVSSPPDLARPPMPGRTVSTLSASSTASSLLRASPNKDDELQYATGQLSLAMQRGSPGDSGSVGTPEAITNSASAIAFAVTPTAPMPRVKERRASKAGLAGLKEFLRSLKRDRSIPVVEAASIAGSAPLATRQATRSSSRFIAKSSTSVSRSPSIPSAGQEGNPTYPARHGSATPQTPGFPGDLSRPPIAQSPSVSFQDPPPARSGTAKTVMGSPQLGNEHKRPSLRNMFRNSSGNWSDLVRDSAPLSFTSSGGNSASGGITGSPKLAGLTKKLSSHRLAFGGSPRSAAVSSGGAGGSRISVSDPMPSQAPVSSTVTLSPPLRSSGPSRTGPSGVSELGGGTPVGGQGEMTVRPDRKRLSGLGLGLGWPDSAVTAGRADEMGCVVGASQGAGSTALDQTLRPARGAGTGSEEVLLEQTKGAAPRSPIHKDASEPRPSASLGGDTLVALTPDNLPTLLEYLRQCESRLEEWRGRIEEIVGSVGASRAVV